MGYSLGLDLGSNSIGWALVDEEGRKIAGAGVRIFPEGVDRDKQGGEVSKNENRRIKRGMRRQIARRARRKLELRRELVSAGLLPVAEPERAAVLAMEPYALRTRGLDEKLELYEIGRVLVHLNQRRGFKSNRKNVGKNKDEKGMLGQISALAKQIEESRCRTLGEFLHKEREAGGLEVRTRGRHTRREMLQQEFSLIWEKQREFYPDILTAELHAVLRERIIFFQRAMYWPRSVVGQCELEPKQKRCKRADRIAQRFRMFQEINNLRLIEGTGELRPLTIEERTKLIAYLSGAKERTFDEIRKHLGLMESHGFNLEFGDRRKLLGLGTDVALSGKKLFGKAWWDKPEDEKDAIAETLLDDSIEEDAILRMAVEKWKASPAVAKELVGLNLGDGYASLSKMAMRKLLPHLERGLPLSGKTGEDNALHAAGYVRADERVANEKKMLPEPPDVTNPIVRHALHQVRQLINAIIREHLQGDPKNLASIRIELAREVKGTAMDRARQSMDMRAREARRDVVRKVIEENGVRPTRKAIELYMLWEEQGKICMYSGQSISVVELFGGAVDVDHILPYSRSLDDSLMNKVVAFREENQLKGQRTPFEWLAEREPVKYEAVLQRAAKFPIDVRNRKRQKFAQKSVELTEFIERQLNDTKYITKKVAEYLQCLGVDVVATKGQLTSELRHDWGLDTVLRLDGVAKKNREDHRHHAVDAVVIALTDRKRLQALAHAKDTDVLPFPWEGFREEVERAVNEINVSYRVERRVSGALHEETIYGPTAKSSKGGPEVRRDVDGRVVERPWATGWIEEAGAFVYRKELTALTAGMVEDIRDPTVRKLVEARLREHGIEAGASKGIPASVWKEPLRMPGENGPVIKKIRLVKRDDTVQPIRGGSTFVKTGSNHHVCIFEWEEDGKKKRESVFVSMLEASRRISKKEPLIRREHPTRKDAKFVMSLSSGEMVQAEIEGQNRLMVYRTGASTSGQLSFVSHTDARQSKEIKKYVPRASTLKAKKVTVDLLGRIRWAND
jgi:CRISPR-associated endonuclease Csn1